MVIEKWWETNCGKSDQDDGIFRRIAYASTIPTAVGGWLLTGSLATSVQLSLTVPVVYNAIMYMNRAPEPRKTFAYTDYRILADAATKLMDEVSNSTGDPDLASQSQSEHAKTLDRINADLAETLKEVDKALASATQG